METAEVNAEMTGAEMKPSRRPEFMKNVENSNVLMGQTPKLIYSRISRYVAILKTFEIAKFPNKTHHSAF